MKIAIAGYGAEGKSNYAYFCALGHDVTIVDERSLVDDIPTGASTMLGEGVFARLEGFDMVVRTAGLAPAKITTDGRIWSATNEFFSRCPAPIIGVTGSKGKGTTCSFIASILREAGKTVYLIGNIGVPSLDVLPQISPDDIAVYELSSFQLWDLEKSPQVAVVLHIEPDHLDIHVDMNDYLMAKSHIARYQQPDDLIIYNGTNDWSKEIVAASPARRLAYQSDTSAHVRDGYFWYGERQLCAVSTLRLPGVHNQDNACAAIDAAWAHTQDVAAIERGLQSFAGLPHRLKYIRSVHDVLYYDDSIATTPGSAIAAIRAFSQPKVLIVGGSNKGADYTDLVEMIMTNDTMRAIIAIGEQGPVIAQLLKNRGAGGLVSVTDAKSMTDIVAQAATCAQPGDVVVLSPACASFDMFQSYSDRGDQFIAAVNALDQSVTIE